MPKDLGSFAHVIVITQRFTVFCYSILDTVLEILSLFVTGRLKDALQKYIFILLTGGLMLSP
jgi:hypothetical protein